MKRTKKILKWTGIVSAGMVLILLAANGLFVWITDARLERQLAAIREAGDPVTLADLAPPPIPPEENALTYLHRAEADIHAIASKVETEEFGAIINANVSYGSFTLPPKLHDAIRAALDANPNGIRLLEQAVACPDYDTQLDYTRSWGEVISQMLPDFQKLRSAANVLRYRGWLLVADKDYDEAMRNALLLFRLSRHCKRIPLLIGNIAAITIHSMAVDSANLVLQTGSVSKEVRDALDAELAISEGLEDFARASRNDRVATLNLLSTCSFRYFWLIGRGLWNQRESEYLDKMQTFLAILQAPTPYPQAEMVFGRDLFQIPPARRDPTMWERQPFLGMPAALVAVIRMQAQLRCLRVLNAIQARVPADSNEVPKLGELGLPPEATIDPFNGEPLHIKKLPEGWLVYSVGRNLQDDGGKVGNAEGDVGVGPLKPYVPPAEQDDKK